MTRDALKRPLEPVNPTQPMQPPRPGQPNPFRGLNFPITSPSSEQLEAARNRANNADAEIMQTAKPALEGWTKSFTGTADGIAVTLELQRSTEGDLSGNYRTSAAPTPVTVTGKLLEDNDLFLQGSSGATFHGRYTDHNTLLFGNVRLPASPGKPAQELSNLEMKPGTIPGPTPSNTGGGNDTLWQGRTFSANLAGTDGDRRADFNLNRQGAKITGSFAVHGTGHGTITKGEFNPDNKTSPLHLECSFDDGELSGQTRVLDGWFLYAEGVTKRDENNDGRDDSSGAALPLLMGGIWKGGKKDYKLEPISPSASTGSTERVSSVREDQPDGSKSWEDTITPAMRDKLPALKESGFLLGVEALARRLSVPRDHLLALMMLESSLDPAKDNGKGYYGLIQIGEAARLTIDNHIKANRLGLRKLGLAERVAQLSAMQQLSYIEIHFLEHGIRERIADFRNGGNPITLEELYMSVLGGNASLASRPAWKVSPTPGYQNNKGLDSDRDGTITPTEATDTLRLRWRETFGTNLDERSEHLERSRDGTITSHEDSVSELPRNQDSSRASWEASIEDQRAYKKNGMNDWGEVLGEANGVRAYFNAGDTGNQGRNKLIKDGKEEYDFGLRWQCVEFIRRYLHTVKGHAFEEKGHAKDYFNEGVEDGGSYRGLRQYSNDLKHGSQSRPQVHDLIVIKEARENGGVGHVAIVIDVADDYVTIAQQNVGTQFTDTIKLSSINQGKDTHWKLDDARVYGWLRKG